MHVSCMCLIALWIVWPVKVRSIFNWSYRYLSQNNTYCIWLLYSIAEELGMTHISHLVESNSPGLWLCNLQRARQKYLCSVALLKKQKTKIQQTLEYTTSANTLLHSSRSYTFSVENNISSSLDLVMQLEARLFGCKRRIHAWQKGGVSKGKRTACRWEHGSYRRKMSQIMSK